MRFNEIVAQPKTSEQQRIDALKAAKDRAAQSLAAERQRQQISKAQKSLTAARQIKLNVQ